MTSPYDLSPTFGALLIGVLFAGFFQGVLTMQTYYYYQDFPEDPRTTKYLVAALWLFDLMHFIIISYTIYHYLVTIWGDFHSLMYLVPAFGLHLLPLAFSTLVSQLFFLYRIWMFSQKNIWIVGPAFVLSLATFSLIFTTGALSLARLGFRQGLVCMVAVGTVTDVSIAVLLCYYLRKRSKGTRRMKVTSTLVAQVIRYTVATSALTSFLILACLFMFLGVRRTWYFIALHFSSGRTYSIAVLVNLNARRKFRETLEGIEPSFAKTIDLGESSGGTQRIPRLNTSTHGQSSRVPTTASRSMVGGNKFGPFVQVPLNAYPPRSRHSLP